MGRASTLRRTDSYKRIHPARDDGRSWRIDGVGRYRRSISGLAMVLRVGCGYEECMILPAVFCLAWLALGAAAPPAPATLRPLASDAAKDADLHQRLFAALAAARTEAEGRAIEDEIWRYWLDLAPDRQSRQLVDEAMRRREAYDLAGAEQLLDQAVGRAPAFPEAWNQRAFVRFLRDNDQGAEEDLLKTLELEPQHFGALSGLFHVLFRQGRVEAAMSALQKAVRIHPWLKERAMLPPDPDAVRPPVSGREQDL